MKDKIILTFDLEFWHNSNFLKKYIPENKDVDYITESIQPILDLMDKHGHKATFFVLGQVAEKYPDLIKKIHNLGHEIASHGYSHAHLDVLNKEEFEEEIKITNNIIKNIIDKEPQCFRAPNFSLTPKNEWAREIIGKYFKYCSDVRPLFFFKPGGFYFRILPLKLFLFLTKIFSKQKPPVLYFHPYELFESSPKINSAPWLKRKIKYLGTKNAWKKFENLQERFRFISFKDHFYENSSY